MSVWPSRSDLMLAMHMGHDPNSVTSSCSCDWKANGRLGIPGHVQLANHIWMIIYEAKKDRVDRMGEKICMPCKGTGNSTLFDRTCSECGGSGVMADIGKQAKLKRIAIHLGHEMQADGRCICGSDKSWERHAMEVAVNAMEELEEFENQLRVNGGGRG